MSNLLNSDPKLLVIGELNVDMILDEVVSFPELGKEKTAEDFTVTLGSSSAIFASNITRLGTETYFCGMVGSDSFGEQVITQLRSYGVNTNYIQKDNALKTGVTVIVRHNGDRAMITYPGTMKYFSLQHIPDEVFGQASHLHISSVFLQPNIKRDLFRIIDIAKGFGMTVSVDPQWDPEEKWDLDLEKLISKIDFFLPNEAEFLSFISAETVEQGLEQMQALQHSCTIVVKRGSDGATYLSDNCIATVPAFNNPNVVDAIGAGDSFDAGLVFQFLRDAPIAQCVKFGNITGAVSTTRAGGTNAIADMDSVIKIAQSKLSITDLDDFKR